MVQPPWERLRERVPRAPVQRGGAELCPAEHGQPRICPLRGRLPLGPVLRGRPRVPRDQRDAELALQLETFDPHEPFTARSASRRRSRPVERPCARLAALCPVDELHEECEELRANYYALVALCDHLLGTCSTSSTRTTCGRTRS
jgi:hypothetical protein